jgi:hypothetical protein
MPPHLGACTYLLARTGVLMRSVSRVRICSNLLTAVNPSVTAHAGRHCSGCGGNWNTGVAVVPVPSSGG